MNEHADRDKGKFVHYVCLKLYRTKAMFTPSCGVH